MSDYRAPLRDMKFLLHQVFAVDRFFAAMPDTEEVSSDLVDAILDEAGKFVAAELAPLNRNGDQQGCQFDAGVVTTPDGFKQAFAAFAAGGWIGLTGNPAHGGQGMPKLLAALVEEMTFAANSSFALYSILTTGASLTISEHGSEKLKQAYLPQLYSGQWTATMCLTEAHAGTDLGMIHSRAVPDGDGRYRISGSKIFITAGEHDLAENIIHLVLAKLPDAPDGARGISLFLVPKFHVDDAGNLAGRNQVSCGSIEHKMGIHGSATCVMNFEEAVGYLVGSPHQGLSHMFTMMNYERLSMGLQGNGLAEHSYQVASAYALDRLQGRAAMGGSSGKADAIIVHADVRRMLLTMRANIVAGRALSIYAAMQLDAERFHPDEGARKRAQHLVALLIPVQKAFCSDRGFESCVLAQQVLGGHGYVAEWGLEQNVRDARIAMIYEGANGIQALDLAGRKTVKAGGQLQSILLEEIAQCLAQHRNNQELA
ncbi:MAG: acyl-CoA dehydrogenase family protein, partial [Gammaproteobacteria bacterium]